MSRDCRSILDLALYRDIHEDYIGVYPGYLRTIWGYVGIM